MSNIVAIIGKPNVGKSTIFNKLIDHNQAIVDNIPGITRDRHYQTAQWNNHTFTLVDTGGYLNPKKDPINTQINQQIQIAINESTLILLVVDSKTGITAEDHLLAQQLRKIDKPILLVANKSDNTHLSLQAATFHRLGLGHVHQISAIHSTGTGDLLDAIIHHLPQKQPTPATQIPKIAFIGRTNTGKSTFVNALLGKQRNIVAHTQHTTRTPTNSHYRLYNKEVILIDTAGIIKKKQLPKKSVTFYALIRTIKAIEKADICLVFLDAQQGLTNQDKHILSLAHRKKKGIILLVNKCDLIQKDTTTAAYRQTLQQQLSFMQYIPILFTAGLHKKNIYQTIEKAINIHQNLHRKVATPTLNKLIQQITTQKPPPAIKAHPITINYITQLPTSSPMFAIFCNLPQHIPIQYKRYLEKQLRLSINFEGVPITLYFRKKNA